MKTFKNASLESCAGVVFLVYLYVLLEWLFFATKPSFLTASPISDQLIALAIGALPFAVAALLVHGMLLVAGRKIRRGRNLLNRLVPAMVVAVGALILCDNFTYTVFGFGLVHAEWDRVAYLSGMGLVVWLYAARPTSQSRPQGDQPNGNGGKERQRSLRLRTALASGMLAVSVAIFLAANLLPQEGMDPLSEFGVVDSAEQRPNIILFAADGITASRMSAYGYHRATTPHLDQRLSSGLVFENAFTNSSRTTGSVTSMATGRYPATTKVLFPPYTLQGRDAYQTLPRLLRKHGYRTIQESVRYYADGPDLEWRDAFDFANDRWIRDASLAFDPELQLASSFVDAMSSRVIERLLHLFAAKKMINPFGEVAGQVYGTPDEERMERVFAFIEDGEGPFFAHIHLMETHCCNFNPKERKFSRGYHVSDEGFEEAAYDDSIREADQHFGELIEFLEKRGLLQSTLIVISSDHTKGWDFREQVPLIFFFPDERHRGRLTRPAQLLDIAPTILDYLDVPTPSWFEGESLLSADFPLERPLFAISDLQRERFHDDPQNGLSRLKSVGPPTYGLLEMGMVICQRWYAMEIDGGAMRTGEIATYREPCDAESLPPVGQAQEMIAAHLKSRGFSLNVGSDT